MRVLFCLLKVYLCFKSWPFLLGEYSESEYWNKCRLRFFSIFDLYRQKKKVFFTYLTPPYYSYREFQIMGSKVWSGDHRKLFRRDFSPTNLYILNPFEAWKSSKEFNLIFYGNLKFLYILAVLIHNEFIS